MRKWTQLGIALLAITAVLGCSGEKPLSESESMAGVLKEGGVSPEGTSRDVGMPKASDKPAEPKGN